MRICGCLQKAQVRKTLTGSTTSSTWASSPSLAMVLRMVVAMLAMLFLTPANTERCFKEVSEPFHHFWAMLNL